MARRSATASSARRCWTSALTSASSRWSTSACPLAARSDATARRVATRSAAVRWTAARWAAACLLTARRPFARRAAARSAAACRAARRSAAASACCPGAARRALLPAGGLAAPGGLPFDVLPGVHRRDDLPPPAQLVVGSRAVRDVHLRYHRQGGLGRRVDGVGARVDPRHRLEDVQVHVAAPAPDRAVPAHPPGSRAARRVGEVHDRRPAVIGELEHEAATRRGAVGDVATCEGRARCCEAAHAEIVAERGVPTAVAGG